MTTEANFKKLLASLDLVNSSEDLFSEIKILEAQFATAKPTIANAPAQETAVLKKWLE